MGTYWHQGVWTSWAKPVLKHLGQNTTTSMLVLPVGVLLGLQQKGSAW